MIGYIKGNVLSINDGTALIENNGVGYEIFCSATACENLERNRCGEVYTYLAVREDGLYLYGFSSPEEKQMFIKLISVSGVGPKIGIAVLAGMSLNDLAIKIATSDVKGLSKIKGLGKKMAERIVLELREKVQADGGGEETAKEAPKSEMSAAAEDAMIALMSLGFSKPECVSVIESAEAEGLTDVQSIVTYSLKHIK